MQKEEMKDMLIDYMGKGFLDNIVSLLKTDGTLYSHIPAMLQDENMRVRLGTAALVEELAPEHSSELRTIVPALMVLLKHENPVVRGDTAYVLGIIKDPQAEEALQQLLHDDNEGVRESAQDALEEILGSASSRNT